MYHLILKCGECCKGRYFCGHWPLLYDASLPIRVQEERRFEKAKQGEIPALFPFSHLSKPDELANFD